MRGVTWRARNTTTEQIATTYNGHELSVYPIRRFTWGITVDGAVWEYDDIPASWPSEAGAMIAAMNISDTMDKHKKRRGRVIDLTRARP